MGKQNKVLPNLRPLFVLLGATLVVFNQTILTNAELEFSNHYSIVTNLILRLTVVWLIYIVFYRQKLLGYALIATLTLLITAQTWSRMSEHWSDFTAQASAQEHRQTISKMIEVLEKLPAQQVVATPLSLATYLTIYTSHYPLLSDMSRLMPMADAELVTRTRMMRSLFPDDTLDERITFGTRHINLALHKQIECRMLNFVRLQKESCEDIQARQFLPIDPWSESQNPLPAEQLYEALTSRHVGYVLAAEVPDALESKLKLVDTIGTYRLYQLNQETQ